MQAMATASRPKKCAVVNLYLERYYKSHIKESFDKAWASASATLPKSARIQMCKQFIVESWENETAEFREALEKEMADAYKAEMKAFQNGTAWVPRTAEEYAKYVIFCIDTKKKHNNVSQRNERFSKHLDTVSGCHFPATWNVCCGDDGWAT
jgi:hypothetical protein